MKPAKNNIPIFGKSEKLVVIFLTLIYFILELVINYILYKQLTIASAGIDVIVLEFWVKIIGAFGLALFIYPNYRMWADRVSASNSIFRYSFIILLQLTTFIIVVCILSGIIYSLGLVITEPNIDIPFMIGEGLHPYKIALLTIIVASVTLLISSLKFRFIRSLYLFLTCFFCAIPISYFLQESIINIFVANASQEKLNKAPLIASANALTVPSFGFLPTIPLRTIESPEISEYVYEPEKVELRALDKIILPIFSLSGEALEFNPHINKDAKTLDKFWNTKEFKLYDPAEYKYLSELTKYNDFIYNEDNRNLRVNTYISMKIYANHYFKLSQKCSKQLGLTSFSGVDRMFLAYSMLYNKDLDIESLKTQVIKHHHCIFTNNIVIRKILPPNIIEKELSKNYANYKDKSNDVIKYQGTWKEQHALDRWYSGVDEEFGFKTTLPPGLTYTQYIEHPDVQRYTMQKINEEERNNQNLQDPEWRKSHKEELALQEALKIYPSGTNYKQQAIQAFSNYVLNTKLSGLQDYAIFPKTQEQAYRSIILPFVGMTLSIILIVLNITSIIQLLIEIILPKVNRIVSWIIKISLLTIFLALPLIYNNYLTDSPLIAFIAFYQSIMIKIYTLFL